MRIETINYGTMSCEIRSDNADSCFTENLKYRSFEVGLISGPDKGSVRDQFRAICEIAEDGGMVRRGLIMVGYHNSVSKGDVLRVDGEIIGEWMSDDEEWCHFTVDGASEITFSSPSLWMLHDAIADWI